MAIAVRSFLLVNNVSQLFFSFWANGRYRAWLLTCALTETIVHSGGCFSYIRLQSHDTNVSFAICCENSVKTTNLKLCCSFRVTLSICTQELDPARTSYLTLILFTFCKSHFNVALQFQWRVLLLSCRLTNLYFWIRTFSGSCHDAILWWDIARYHVVL